MISLHALKTSTVSAKMRLPNEQISSICLKSSVAEEVETAEEQMVYFKERIRRRLVVSMGEAIALGDISSREM